VPTKQSNPKYAQINVPNTSPALQSTTQKARTLRIKEELRFLYKKKETLNREPYRSHLQEAQEWEKWWDPIHESIIQKLTQKWKENTKSWMKK
jgi:predicted nucleotidyltransferase